MPHPPRESATVTVASPLRCPPPPPVPGNAAAQEDGEAAADVPPRVDPPLADADPGDRGAAHQESISAGLAAAPLWAPLGAGSTDPLAQAPPQDMAAPADLVARLPVKDS